LNSFPVQLVFAYDGPDRPAIKRGRSVVTGKDHWMVKPTQRILDAFNIQWFTVCTFSTLFFDGNSHRVYWQAKGEAEAELAAMCSAGAVNAVMTDDSDVFAFGCQRVIRK